MVACDSILSRVITLEHDVIIVGAGPAGSTTARFCAKKGLKLRGRFERFVVLQSNKNLGLLYLHILAGNAHYRAFSREMVDGIRRRLGKKLRP